MNTPTIYTTLDHLAAREILPAVDVPDGYRLDVNAVARAISEWHQELDTHGTPLANRCGYIVSADYRTDDDSDDDSAFWDLIEEHTHPHPDLREETITGDTHEGHWSALIEWRPLPAIGVDPTADRLGHTFILWTDTPPAQIVRQASEHDRGCLLEAVDSRSGTYSLVFTPEQVTDPDADLDAGQYRITEVLLNGEPAELPTVSGLDFRG